MSRETIFLNKATDPAATGRTAARSSSLLPSELLGEASRRLGWAGLIYAGAYFLAYWGPRVIELGFAPGLTMTRIEDGFSILAVAFGTLIFGLSRHARMQAQTFLDVGLGFAVVGALGISVVEFWEGFPAIHVPWTYIGVPWDCVWILILSVVAPNRPRKVLVASLLAAAMAPLTIVLLHYGRGVEIQSRTPQFVSYFLFTNFLCAVIAYFISRIIFGYGMRLKKAREVGSYVLVSRLGEGGMGEVWLARHRMLARPAAMKLIRPDLLGTDERSREVAIKRFEREARDTAALRSTHTVDIYDFGVTDDGSFFYVMELLDGLTLESLVRRFGPIGAGRTVHLLRQVCHSLGEAHASGLVHRDLKPANIFSCRLGPDFDFVKVLDFGLVKHAEPGADTQLTGEGVAAGTPAYMAPEMALGKGTIDGRVDIYALGCVAYWLLTGRPVFEGETPLATILHHVRSEPVPPSKRTEILVPKALDDVILACLAKDPAARPQSAKELDIRLAAAVPAGAWRAEDADEWWRLHYPGLGAPEADVPVEAHTI